jgi:dienelactone hydrolase
MARCFALVVAFQLSAGLAFAQAPDPNRPEPLVCKPAGQAPFAVVIWNHGLVRDPATFANAQRGWRNMCEALAAEGYLACIPIRPFVRNLGPADIGREADEISKAVNTVMAMPDVDRAKVAIMGHSRGATLALMVAVKRRDLAAVILTAPASIPPRFLGDTMDRIRSMPAPVLLMVENGDALGGLEATRDIDERLKRRSKDDHHTIRYDRGGGHFLFIKKDYWWDDLRAFLDEKLKRLEK